MNQKEIEAKINGLNKAMFEAGATQFPLLNVPRQETALRFDAGKPTFHHIHPLVLAYEYGPIVLEEEMVKWFYFGNGNISMSISEKDDMFAVLNFGAKKYASLNYAKGMLYSRVFDSWFRHRFFYPLKKQETIDQESHIKHEGHAQCNQLFALTYAILGYDKSKQFDDRPMLEPLLSIGN